MPQPNSPEYQFDVVSDEDLSDMEELAVRIFSDMHKGEFNSPSPSPPQSPVSPSSPPSHVEHAQAYVKVGSMIKKKRTATSAHQLSILQTSFKQNRYPNQFVRGTLANTCGMSKDRVRIWFQNMRRKMKATEKSPDSPDSMGSPDSPGSPDPNAA